MFQEDRVYFFAELLMYKTDCISLLYSDPHFIAYAYILFFKLNL